jgi:predicted nucleotidyltransferase
MGDVGGIGRGGRADCERDPAEVSRLRAILDARPEVAAAYLFGSAAAGALRRDSDVDVAILLAGAPDARAELDLRLELSSALARAAGREVDVVVLDRAPLLLRYMVYRANRPIFERDPVAARLFRVRSLSRWFDFEPVHRRICRQAIAPMVARAAAHGRG